MIQGPLRAPLSDAALSVWAKNPDQQGENVMSLARHLADSADVAAHVWRWLPLRVRTTIDQALPDDARDGQKLLRFLAGVHDIGKCSPPFADKVSVLAANMATKGLRITQRSDFRSAPHGSVGQVILERWLSQRYSFKRQVATTYGVAVGGHHGAPPSLTILMRLTNTPHLVGTDSWVAVQDELLDAMAERLEVSDLLTRWASTPLPVTVQTLLSGAVIVSDWLASNDELFSLNSFELGDRAEAAWLALGLPPPWASSPAPSDPATLIDKRFPTLAGLPPRPVQRLTLEAAEACESPGLLIVEAAMGAGKTEAALIAAESLASTFDCGGIYVALPTMATSDAMYGRVLSWIRNLDDPAAQSTFLAHGKSGLNEHYSELIRFSRARGVHDDSASLASSEAQVLAWLSGRKTGVLASMVVGTIDQLLFTALQAKHLVLRHLAFAGKVVIIDEAHAADDYMRSYLTRTLEWLAAYGVPVVMMSATLPRAQRQQFADAYRRGARRSSIALPTEQPYPLVTRVCADVVDVHTPREGDHEPGRQVEVRCLGDQQDALINLLHAHLNDGGCAAVIRNTVARAQETARCLADAFPDTEVLLVHSRFVATHRAEREAQLRDLLGRDASQRPDRLIVVGTQVLEQSLDVDFDLMVTDLAPVDLVLQRMGRLHRHTRGVGESDRPPALRVPRVYITGIDAWGHAGMPEPVSVSAGIYSLSRLLRSAAVLGLAPASASLVNLPSAIRSIVEAGYGAEPPGPIEWREAIAMADIDHETALSAQREKATQFQIGHVDETDDLCGWLEYGGGTEADDPRNPGASRVRDSEDGLEVIVVQRDADGHVVCLRDGGPYEGKPAVRSLGPPDYEVARALAAATVRLPLSMTHARVVTEVIAALERDAHEGWQDSGWLKGQLALHLDKHWRAEIAGFSVRYDLDLGLQVERSSP